MPKVNVDASIRIAAPVQKVHDTLVDFNTWPIWSPWLYMEPEAKVSYRGDVGQPGHGYDWLGQKTGSGEMTLRDSSLSRINCDLQFLKPFKSYADVAFNLKAVDDSTTEVTWFMDSSLPFFMFWMKATMIGMIKSDYNRGLSLLKDHLETGEIPSRTVIEGVVDVEAIDYVGVCGAAKMSDLASTMGSSFEQLMGGATAANASVNGTPFSVYNAMDIKTHHCDYTAALPVTEAVSVDAPLMCAKRPACKALKVVHTGPYRHLGNAWSSIMADAKDRKLKVLKSQAPFEHYINDPAETPENNLITEIFLPVR